ncbi:MAG: hypothetical protein V1782_12740 [Pseudomonadota bacterium]
MRTRFAMAAFLVLLLAVQGWGLAAVWRDDPLRSLAPPPQAPAAKKAPAPAPPDKEPSLQPTPPGSQPDLHQGYIFNAERSLAAGGSSNAGNMGMDKVQYSGSVIAGDKTRALLCFPLGGQPAAPARGAAVPQKQGFLRVVVGDTVNGYKVAEILPEKITFSRGGQKITKLLYDKTKERFQAQAPPARDQSGQTVPAPPGLPPAPQQGEQPQIPGPQQGQAATQNTGDRSSTPRRRPESPKEPSPAHVDGQNFLQLLMQSQQQRNNAPGRDGKK